MGVEMIHHVFDQLLLGPCSSADTFAPRSSAISLLSKRNDTLSRLKTLENRIGWHSKRMKMMKKQHIAPAFKVPCHKKQRKQTRNCKYELAQYAHSTYQDPPGMDLIEQT